MKVWFFYYWFFVRFRMSLWIRIWMFIWVFIRMIIWMFTRMTTILFIRILSMMIFRFLSIRIMSRYFRPFIFFWIFMSFISRLMIFYKLLILTFSFLFTWISLLSYQNSFAIILLYQNNKFNFKNISS